MKRYSPLISIISFSLLHCCIMTAVHATVTIDSLSPTGGWAGTDVVDTDDSRRIEESARRV